MRALDFAPYQGEKAQLLGLENIGQRPYYAPAVFSFFDADFRPDGPVSDAGLSSPEAEMALGPFVLAAINGLSSLAEHGLSACKGGFGMRHQLG